MEMMVRTGLTGLAITNATRRIAHFSDLNVKWTGCW